MANKIRYKLLPGYSSNLDSFIAFQTVYSVQFPMTLSCNRHGTQYSLSGRKLYRLSSLLLAFYNSLVTDCFCLSKTEKLGNCIFTSALAFHTRSTLPACGVILTAVPTTQVES